MAQNQRHPFFWVVIFAAAVIASLYVPVGRIIYKYGGLTKDLGWECQQEAGNCVVRKVDPDGYAAGKLQPGDRIEAFNGIPQVLVPGMTRPSTFRAPAAEDYSVTVLRNGAKFDLQLRAKIEKNLRNLPPILVPILSSLVFFIIALIIGLARPDQRFTQLFTFTWFSVALIYMALAIEPMWNFVGTWEFKLSVLLWALSFSPLEAATAYHFCYRFPPGIPESKFWSFLRNFFYITAGLIALVFTLIRVGLLFGTQGALKFFSMHQQLTWLLDRCFETVMISALIGICFLIVRNHIQIREISQRRRLRWVLFGTLFGTIPTVVFIAAQLALTTFHLEGWFRDECLYYLSMFSNVALELIPITIGFAIIRHRMFDINVVVRQGLRYLLAKHVLRVLIYLPAAIVIYTIVTNRDRSVTDILFSSASYVWLTLAAVVGLKFRNQFSGWLDRKFFREAYNSEKILVSLIDEIKKINSISEVSKWVTVQLDSALHPKSTFVFYRTKERGDLALGYSSGEHSNPDLRILQSSKFLRLAESLGTAHVYPSREALHIPDNEKEWLNHLGTHLIVPMNDSEEHLVGLLLLGEKKSEEPYTATDRKMLEALAGQIAVIYENLLLKEKVDEDLRIKREVLSHLQEKNRNLVKECPECGRCFDTNESHCSDDHIELALSLPVDRVVDGKYQLNKLLGRGGMGAVYQATDLRLNREVAIKVLIGSMFGDRVALRRFEREARASAKLNHPNIITVHDFGGIEGEGAYLVMELLHGFSLRSYLKQNGNIEPMIAAGWFDQILEGMKLAHGNGVIHRDLKPENILITKIDGNHQSMIKILDFGLAKTKFLETAESKSITAPGTILGTLHYMSPEQIMGGDVDERTDLFSIGVMVIEALTGQQPFVGETYSEIALAIIQRPYELVGESKQVVVLNTTLQKCIAKNKKDRYGSLEELQVELIDAIRKVPPFPSVLSVSPVRVSGAETRIVI